MQKSLARKKKQEKFVATEAAKDGVVASVTCVSDFSDQADFRRAVGAQRVRIAKCFVLEKRAKTAWQAAREAKRLALIDLLHQTGMGRSSDELATGGEREIHPTAGWDGRVLLAHKMLAEALDSERKARQEFAAAITARQRAIEELQVLIAKWTERQPVFESVVSSKSPAR